MPSDRPSCRRNGFAPSALLLLGTLLFAAPATVRAATFTVSSTGDAFNDATTLRGAIEASKASNDAQDTINITATGTILLSPSYGPLAVYNGRSVAGKTLTISGPGAGRLAISGGGQTGIFSLFDNGSGGITVSINGLTISGGANSNGGAGINTNQALNLTGVVLSGNTTVDSIGGGMVSTNADVTLTDCTVSGNSAVEGPNAVLTSSGGLYANGGTLTLTRCTVSNNHSDDFVGGIENSSGTLTMTGCTVSGNVTGGNTGGIENDGTATLTGCTVSGNTGDYGAGLYNSVMLTLAGCTISGNTVPSGYGGGLFSQISQGGGLTVTSTTFAGNTADAGGGVCCYVDGVMSGSGVSSTFAGCTFSGNTAQEGGGVYNYSDASVSASGTISTTFTGCTFSGNSASGDFGGGLYIDSRGSGGGDAPLTTALTNCTLSGNAAPDGGGGLDFSNIVSTGVAVRATCVVQSSLIAGNTLTGASAGPDVDIHDENQGNVTSGGSNLIGVGNGDLTAGTGHDRVGTGAAPLAPHLGALASNGGPTQTLALLAGSPALDADYNTGATADGRGMPRPSGARNDIGAFEHQSPTAAPAAFTTTTGVAKTVSAPGVLAGSTGPDATGGLTAVVATAAGHGALTLNADGSFTYTPAAGFSGTDSFTYGVNDGVVNSAAATVTLTVQPAPAQDVTPPVTAASLNPAAPTGGGGYYRQSVSVTLTATDDASGVASTVYSVNGGAPQAYSGAFALSADGVYALSYHSVDAAGNVETAKALTVKIDATAPRLTFGTPTPAPNGNGWNNAPVTIPSTSTDNLSGVASTTPTPARVTAEGAGQTVTVTVTDVAGNSATFHTPAVNIDSSKPVTTATTQGTETGEQVTLSATDSLSGVAATVYSVDGGAPQTYSGAFVVTGNGPHTVTYSSTDKADNAEGTKTTSFTVNIAAPVTTASVAGPLGNNGYYTGPVTVTLTAKSASSRITGTSYRVDDGPQTTYQSPFTVSGDKAHIVTYSSTDAAGNIEAAHTLSLKIDGIAPVTTGEAAGPQTGAGVYTGAVTVTLTAADDFAGVAGITYAVDSGAAQAYTAPIGVGSAGDHKVTFFSADAAGNVEAAETLTFTIQLTSPTPAPVVAHTFAAGLQMFSVPADYGAIPLGTALSQAGLKLAVWEPALTQYVLSPTAPADALRSGQGYWARFSQATDLYALGTPTPTDRPFAITLTKGWNMIGDPFPGAVGLSGVQVQSGGKTYTGLDAASKAGVTGVTLYSYPAGAGTYQAQDSSGSLAPYSGYWLYAFGDCTLEVPAP